MARPWKILLVFVAGAGCLLALLAAAFLLAPRLVNVVAIKERALTLVERETGVRLSYARAEITLFPRPRLAVRGVGVEVPGLAQGTITSLEADPELLPLLRGIVRIGSLVLEAPDLRVRLPATKSKVGPVSLEEVEQGLSSLLGRLRQKMPGTVVTIRRARLELIDGDGPIVSLRELEARVALPPDRLTVHIRCASQYWDGLTIDTSLRPGGLRAETRFDTAGFRVRDLAERLAPGAVPWVGETVLSLRGRIDSEGARVAKAEVAGAIPILTIRREARSRVVRVRTFEGAFELTARGIRGTLADLVLDDPRVRLSGDLAVDRASSRIEVRLTGQGLEIAPVRDILLALAGDVRTVGDVLDVVRGGTVARFSLQSAGRSAGDLGDPSRLRFQASLSGGSIFIPGPGLALEEVGAQLTLANGILAGREIAARLGRARARRGSIRMGIAGPDPPFHAEFQADVDAGELPPLLRRLVRDRAFREEVDRIRDLRGDASGRVVLGERMSSLGVKLTVSKMRLTAKHARIPFPIALDGGRVAYDGAAVVVTDLAGSVGRSSFSGVTGRLGLSTAMGLSVPSGRARVDLGELYPWIASFEAVREAAKDVHSLRGVADVGSLSLAGPLRGAGEWAFDVAGTVSGLELETPRLPGPLSVPTARVRIRPGSATFSGVAASLLDTTVRGALELTGYRRGSDRVAASFEGGVGPVTATWVYERVGVPEPFRLRAPFTVAGSDISWEKGAALRATADVRYPGGTALTFSVLAAPGSTTIDPLVIRGVDSDARMGVHVEPATLRARFAGTLTRSTLEQILPVAVLSGQRVRGEMEAVLDRDNPSRSSARGTIEASGVAIPWDPLAPLAIRHISLAADGRTIRVVSSDLAWGDVPLSLTGTAGFGGREIEVDLDVSAGELDIRKLRHTLEARAAARGGGDGGRTAAPEQRGPTPPGPARFPLQGVIRVRADSVSLGRFTWRPVRAHAQLDGGTIRVTVTEANLCGIVVQGSARLGAGAPVFDLTASASGEQVAATTRCLTEERVAATGQFRMSARLEGEGVGEALVRSLRGPAEVELKDGRIQRMTLLSRVFELLNVTDLFRGKFPDFGAEGFAYKTFVIRGEAKDGKFVLREAVLDSRSMGLVASGQVDLATFEGRLTVLVAPLRIVNYIVRAVPVLGYILGGSVVSVPVAVTGNLRDPRVTPMTPGAVGDELLGIFKRALKAPARILSPFLPGKPGKAPDGAPAPAGP